MNVNGYATVFGVLDVVHARDCRPAWYRVQLPVRPNGSSGYVKARAVDVVRIRMRLVIDLSDRRIDILRDGRRVRTIPTGIGSSDTPTPTGRFYVNQKLLAPNPAGAYGPGAIGISAFAPKLVYWPQGGPIAIHGTNVPASIGRAVSHGCLRIANGSVKHLFGVIPAGTPVVIRA
jgi:lipoprotein-anchoring transpeptidase ErfK/SrfK